jgi:hypothetical protein
VTAGHRFPRPRDTLRFSAIPPNHLYQGVNVDRFPETPQGCKRSRGRRIGGCNDHHGNLRQSGLSQQF